MESCWLLFENHYQPESVKLPTVTLAETASIRLAHEKHLCEYHRNHVDSEKIFNLKIQNEKKIKNWNTKKVDWIKFGWCSVQIWYQRENSKYFVPNRISKSYRSILTVRMYELSKWKINY